MRAANVEAIGRKTVSGQNGRRARARGVEGLRYDGAAMHGRHDARDTLDAHGVMAEPDGDRQIVREQPAIRAGVEMAGGVVITCVTACVTACVRGVALVRLRCIDGAQHRLRIARGSALGEGLADDRRDNGKPHGGDAEPCDEAIARVASHEGRLGAEAEELNEIVGRQRTSCNRAMRMTGIGCLTAATQFRRHRQTNQLEFRAWHNGPVPNAACEDGEIGRRTRFRS